MTHELYSGFASNYLNNAIEYEKILSSILTEHIANVKAHSESIRNPTTPQVKLEAMEDIGKYIDNATEALRKFKEASICSAYLAGIRLDTISIDFNTSIPTIKKILKKANISYKKV